MSGSIHSWDDPPTPAVSVTSPPPRWPTVLAWVFLVGGIVGLCHGLNGRTNLRLELAIWSLQLIPLAAACEYAIAFVLLHPTPRRRRWGWMVLPLVAGIGTALWLGVYAGVMVWLTASAGLGWMLLGAAAFSRIASDQPSRASLYRWGALAGVAIAIPALVIAYAHLAVWFPQLPLFTSWLDHKVDAAIGAPELLLTVVLLLSCGGCFLWLLRRRLRRRLLRQRDEQAVAVPGHRPGEVV